MFIIDTNQKATSLRLKDDLLPILEREQTVVDEELDAGDVAFKGRDKDGKLTLAIGVELKKSPSDIMSSLRDGRLMTQLPKMLGLYDLSYVLTIGSPMQLNSKTGKVREQRRQKGTLRWIDSTYSFHYLNSILVKFEAAGGRIRHVGSMKDAAAFLLSLQRYWYETKHSEETFISASSRMLDWRMLDNPLAEVYERIPIGVDKKGRIRHLGIKRAVQLAEYCTELIDLTDVKTSELVSLPGFGRKTAVAVMDFIHQGMKGVDGYA